MYPLGGPGGNGGSILNSSWKCNYSIYLDIWVYYLDIQAITTLLCLLLVLYVLFPSIHSFFYLTTALLKSAIFRHSKAYSSQSQSFQPTGIGLGSLWRGKRCVLPIRGQFQKNCNFFLQIFKFAYFSEKNMLISKNSIKFIIIIFFLNCNW